jgi:hypothetical protein
VLLQQYVPVQNIYSLLNLSPNENVSFSVSPPEKMPASDSSMMTSGKEKTISEKVIHTPYVDLNDKPAQQQFNINNGKIVGSPVMQRPLSTVKPQSATHAASNVASTNQNSKIPLPTQAPKPLYQKAPLPIGVVQSAPGSLAPSASLEPPLNKDDAVPVPVGENQLVDPVSSKQ